MKILIVEAYTAANIGSGALVENAVRLLQENFPGCSIEILAQSPESIEKLTRLSTFHELITLPLGQSRPRQFVWLLKTGVWMMAHSLAMLLHKTGVCIPESFYTFDRQTLTALRKIQEADMVVSVGAERINDNFYKAILFSLFMLGCVKRYDKFLVLFPQTVGPFHFRLSRYLSAKILNQCDVIFTRDRRSDEILKQIDVCRPVILKSYDVALLQPPVSPEEARKLLADAGVEADDRPLVGISAMKWSYIKAEGKSGYDDYKEAIAKAADDLIEEKKVRIVFLATNVLTEGCREDDVAAADDIIACMKHKTMASVLNRLYTAGQIKGIMGLFSLCLVTRMHACIFSTGIHTPTCSINYQFKLYEYMKLMGLGGYSIDIDQVTYAELKKIIDETWNHRAVIRKTLEQKVSAYQSSLRNDMARLPDLLRSDQQGDPV